MNTITIRNVGPIKDVTLDLNKVNVIMGPQSSGKSTIAKWIAEKYGYEFQKSPSENFAKVREVFDKPETGMWERLAFYMGDCLRMSMLLRQESNKKYGLIHKKMNYSHSLQITKAFCTSSNQCTRDKAH